jgi:hypothetical protein
MAEKIIQQADIRTIENNISVLAREVNEANRNIVVVNDKVEDVDSRINQLFQEFREFVEKDIMVKELQLAETRLVKVRQELENKFGHFELVRKQTVGILQAVDTGIVRKETITTSSEELMLSTPGYWLAPCLVALSAWICNEKELAEKALNEAIRRDDEKTSLFFALVNRRLGRYEACEVWVRRYFSMQDPEKLEREMIVVLDAYANGMFGADSSGECSNKIQAWLRELSERNGFIQEQRENWKKAIRIKEGKVNDDRYVYLKKHSAQWSNIEASLNGATIHDNLLNYFKGIFEGDIYISPNLKIALDDLLTKSVTNFDKEELPLRKQEDYLQAVVDSEGDKNMAVRKSELSQKAYEEYVNFAQLLTNASMFQDGAHASKATQRLATALSKAWIVEAYDDIVAENRLNVPSTINFNIDEWTGLTEDGSNEESLIKDFSELSDRKRAGELANAKLKFGNFAKLGIGIILGFVLIAIPILGVAVWAVFGYLFYKDYKKVKDLRISIPQKYEQYKESGVSLIRAILAEVVDYRREFEKEDKKAEGTRAYMENIQHGQYIYNSYSTARNIMV